MSNPNMDEHDLMVLVVRRSGTWDYRYAEGLDDNSVKCMLQDIVGQIESNQFKQHPDSKRNGNNVI